ncbi:MAG: hypothetical protein ABI461_16500 [Polyangiaceae bacterium]
MFLAAIVVAALATNCLPSDECLRFSDCNEGLTCAFGKCVVPPAQSGEGGADDEGGSSEPDGAVVTFDSGTPSDSSIGDATADDSGDASDAGSADAADD